MVNEVDIEKLIDFDKSIPENDIKEWDIHFIQRNSKVLKSAAEHYGYDFDLNDNIKDYNESVKLCSYMVQIVVLWKLDTPI